MKVLHILGELNYSGAEVMLKFAKPKFVLNGIETTILSTGKSAIGDFSEELIGCSYDVSHIPFNKSISFVKDIFLFFRKSKFDVVHIHTERFFFFYIVIAKFAGVKKIVRTIHSTFFFQGWLRFRRRAMLKYGLLLGCRYISISKNVYENELENNSIETILINNWIDTNYYKPLLENKKVEENRIKLISVGACSHVKQHFCILQLVSEFKKAGYLINYFHLGAGELEEDEKALTDKLNIADSVNFIGNGSNVLSYLHQSDFFIMPSQYEGLGNACIEAMASGIIPIVNDVPGLRDLVKHKENGLVLDFNNIELVKNSIINLINDEGQKEVLRSNARSKVVDLYSLDNVNQQIEIYLRE